MLCRNALWHFFQGRHNFWCWLSRDCARNWGRSPFNRNVRFELSATSRSEWNGILQNFQKQGNLARYTQIVEFFSRKFSFQSTLLPENLEFSVEWFPIRKFDSFREISVRFAAVSKFWKVLVEWKAPWV